MKIYTVANQKGGVCKTTTAHLLATGLMHTGAKVLAVDCDPQTNFSFISGIINAQATLYDLFTEELQPEEVIVKAKPDFDIIPGSTKLLGADNTFKGFSHLRRILQPLSAKYDYIVIDTPPNLGTLLFNAMATSNSVIVPMYADALSMQGLAQLTEAIRTVQEAPVSNGGNPYLQLEGVLLSRHSDRTNLSRDIKEGLESITKNLGTKLFKTTIREAVAIKEVQFNQGDLYKDFPKAKVTEDCRAFIKELTGRKVK